MGEKAIRTASQKTGTKEASLGSGRSERNLVGHLLSHYEILEQIGAGGMGIVYKARDTRLGRLVAVKVLQLRAESTPEQVRRFVQEARAASALNHPNIVTIYDVGQAEGQHFIAMEHLPGRTLREVIPSRGLPIDEALRYAIQIAGGLARAHEAGIIHRDLKPSNISVDEQGQVKLLDFGLAKLTESLDDQTRTESTGEPLTTQSGAILGTAAYMSPEQAEGRPVDARSDIFSFGALLYEMVTGMRAFQGNSPGATLAAVIRDEPRPAREIVADIPPDLTMIIQRCLRKDPTFRAQTISGVKTELQNIGQRPTAGTAALVSPRSGSAAIWSSLPIVRRLNPGRARRLAIGSLVGVLLLAIILVIWVQPNREIASGESAAALVETLPSQKHLAVLPFRNLGGETTGQALCDGVVETLTSGLTSIQQFQGSLWIVPSTEIWAKGVNSVEDARQIFGVTLVITGSIQIRGETLTITVNLVDARSLRQVASAIFEEARAVPSLRRDIVQRVADMLRLSVRPEEMHRLSAGGTAIAEAYALYLRGRGYLQRYDRSTNLDLAVQLLQQAIDRDPTFALAKAGLAEAYYRKFEDSKDKTYLDRASELCRQSILLDGTLAPVHVVQGLIQSAGGRWDEALISYSAALELDPVNAAGFRGLATTYEELGQFEEAERIYQRAIELRPGLWSGYNELGVFYANRGRYDEAIRQFQQVVRLSPDNARGYFNLGALLYYTGELEQAEAMLKKSLTLSETPEGYTNLGTVYYVQKRYREATQMMEKAIDLGGGDYRLWGNLANSYEQIAGAETKARETYQKAIEQCQEQLRINQQDSEVRAHLAFYLAKSGHHAAAHREIEEVLKAASGATGAVLFRAAVTLEVLGERRRALETLERAVKAGHSLDEIENTRSLEGLRRDPRYKRMIQRQKESPAKGR